MEKIALARSDALLVVDMQNDFLQGGSIAVAGSDEIVPLLNRYIELFSGKGLAVIACRDWHPQNHCSFVEQGGSWPAHCVAGSFGAQFSPQLILPPAIPIISQAQRADKETHSAFEDSGLDPLLKKLGIKRIFIGGLTTDYCILSSVRDARLLDYQAVVLYDAVRALNIHPGDGRNAVEEIANLGARLVEACEMA